MAVDDDRSEMEEIEREGTLLVVSGPSGAGKSTLCRRLVEEFDLQFSISYTTRPPRPAEVDGVDYHFVSKEEFAELVDNGEFAEHATVHSHQYGTARKTVLDAVDAGYDLIFDIDYQGAEQLTAAFPRACGVLILPPSMEELEARLRARSTDTEDVISRRLEVSRHEIAQFERFDYIVINGDVNRAYADFRSIYQAVPHHRDKMRTWVNQLLS